MKTPTIFSLLLFLLFFTSCNRLKTISVLKSGTTSQTNFVGSIPFDFSKKIPFINVKIEGKEYRFMYDTGAPCVISTELYKQLGLEASATSKVGDSSGVKEKQIYTTLNQVELGGINFQDIGAIVMDLNTSEIFDCLDFDGIIGANLMRMAKWEIDYQKNVLRFSDNINKLNTEGESYVLDFSPVRSGTPYVDITVDEVIVKNVTFDTGSAGYLTLPAKPFKDLYPNSDTRQSGYGVTSYGAYGPSSLDTSFYVKTNSINIGKLTESNKMIELENRNKEILGNLFLENYRVIMDWDNEIITLYPTVDNTDKNDNLDNFGYNTRFDNQKVTISYIFNQSSADKAGLKVGDEVIKIGEFKTTDLTSAERCALLFKPYDDVDNISLVILRDGKEIKFSLARSPLF